MKSFAHASLAFCLGYLAAALQAAPQREGVTPNVVQSGGLLSESASALYRDKSANKELAAWLQSAQEGDAEAQCILGILYHNGEGFPKDDIEAVKWFRKAAAQDYPEGQRLLGLALQTGVGGVQDVTEAAKLFQRAIDLGSPMAQNNLGLLYQKGEGVPKDLKKARSCFEKAAAQGEVAAWLNLGLMTAEDGEDLKASAEYMRKAAELNDAAGQRILGIYYSEAGEWRKTMRQHSPGCAKRANRMTHGRGSHWPSFQRKAGERPRTWRRR